MKIKNQLTLGRLVGKIDNDFNIHESDWIPRVAAWTIDALSQLRVLPMEKKKRTLEVVNRIAQYPCKLNAKELKVYTENGCEIPELTDAKTGCGCSGRANVASSEIGVFDSNNEDGINAIQVATVRNAGDRNFVLDCDKIELNFDADNIIVESYEVATYYDEYYDCECPYIYDNGLLLEALAWYCLFKYLSRGSQHPVYSLKTNNALLNPFAQWNSIKYKAANSVKKDLANAGEGWNNFFYNSTFLPRS